MLSGLIQQNPSVFEVVRCDHCAYAAMSKNGAYVICKQEKAYRDLDFFCRNWELGRKPSEKSNFVYYVYAVGCDKDGHLTGRNIYYGIHHDLDCAKDSFAIAKRDMKLVAAGTGEDEGVAFWRLLLEKMEEAIDFTSFVEVVDQLVFPVLACR